MYVMPTLDEDAWELLGIDAETFIKDAVKQYSEKIDTIMSAFF